MEQSSSSSTIWTIATIAVPLLLLVAGIWAFRRVHASPAIGVTAKWILVILGLGCGVAGTFIKYFPTPDEEIDGFPIPVAILQREGDHWVDFVADHAVVLIIALINVFLISTGIHLIALLWMFVRGLRARPGAARPTSSVDAGGVSM